MNIIEAWGSGIPKMFREAKEYGLQEPELIDMGSDFRMNLYRKKAVTDQNGVIDPRKRDTDDTKVDIDDTKIDTNDTKTDSNEEAVLSILQRNPKATQKELCKELGVSIATAKRLTDILQKSGRLYREGSRRSGSWIIINPKE